MTTLAVTGGTGFVGSHVLRIAAENGVAVRALARSPQPALPGVEWVQGSLSDRDSLAHLVTGADAVLHIAGVINARTRAEFDSGNIAGTAALLDAARAAGVGRFVNVSSLAAREPGLSAYGASKAAAEALVAASNLDWDIIRPPGVYGPGDHDMLELFRMAKRGFVLLPPSGRGSWIFVEDLARLLVVAATAQPGLGAQIYEPDDGTPGGLSHVAMGRMIAQAAGRPGALRLSAPRMLLKLAARADRLVRGDAARLTPDRANYMAHPDWVADPARRPPATVWAPQMAPEQGFAATALWYRDQGLL